MRRVTRYLTGVFGAVCLALFPVAAAQAIPVWQFQNVTCSSVDMGRYGSRVNATCKNITTNMNAFKFQAYMCNPGCKWVTSGVAWATKRGQYRSASWNPGGLPQNVVVYGVFCDPAIYPETCIPAP